MRKVALMFDYENDQLIWSFTEETKKKKAYWCDRGPLGLTENAVQPCILSLDLPLKIEKLFLKILSENILMVIKAPYEEVPPKPKEILRFVSDFKVQDDDLYYYSETFFSGHLTCPGGNSGKIDLEEDAYFYPLSLKEKS